MELTTVAGEIPERLRSSNLPRESNDYAPGELWKYKAALEETATLAITDLKGVITYVNRRFCELSGYSEKELLGETHRLINSGYHPKEFYQNLWNTISSGETWRGEIRNRHKSGRAYWSTMTIIPFCDESGKPYQYVSIRNDLSAQQEAAAEHLRLVDTQSQLNLAEEAILKRDRFVSMASHELKTPITALQIRVEVGLRKLRAHQRGLAREDQEKILKSTLMQARRLTRMIDDMLDVSRISAGQLKLKFERENLVRVVDDVLNQFHDDLRRQGIDVSFTAPDAIWGRIDRVRIEQVIINLLTNGMKYGERKLLSVTVEKSGERAFIRIADKGKGMSEEFQARLFQRYARENEGGDIKGQGLGLWITAQIVKAHGGEISVKSKLGEGSVFTVALPLSGNDTGSLTL